MYRVFKMEALRGAALLWTATRLWQQTDSVGGQGQGSEHVSH